MRPTRHITTLDEARELFYQCRFHSLVKEGVQLCATSSEETLYKCLLIANAYFELHEVNEAKAILRKIEHFAPCQHSVAYASARILYFSGETETAYKAFDQLLASNVSERLRFKALLGMANIHLSHKRFDDIPALVDQLSAFEPLTLADERISLMIFLGNYHLGSQTSVDLARRVLSAGVSCCSQSQLDLLHHP